MKFIAYNKIYRSYRGKPSGGRWIVGLLAAAGLVLVLLLGAGVLFWRELTIIGTLRPLEEGSRAYFIEVKGDYHFAEFLAQGGASSDGETSVFLARKISKGLYTPPAGEYGEGCSVLSAVNAGGVHLWGRNYDWTGSTPIIVRHLPAEGYASLSTCDFRNITGSAEAQPVGMINRMLAIAALYVPLDGVNEAGLCVADLEVNEGGMPDPDTEKPDLTITTAIRLLLDRAATVDEALALLEQYDIHPSGGISHHLAISDAEGRSVSVEFTEDGFTAVPAAAVTNFNLAKGDPSAGGDSAKARYETLAACLGSGVSTPGQVRDALAATAQKDPACTTQWSMVYEQSEPYVTWYFDGDFSEGVSLSIPSDRHSR